MISADALNEAIREGQITVTEQRRLLQVVAEIAVRLFHEAQATAANSELSAVTTEATPSGAGNGNEEMQPKQHAAMPQVATLAHAHENERNARNVRKQK